MERWFQGQEDYVVRAESNLISFFVPQFKSESAHGFVDPKPSSQAAKVRQEEAGLERMLPRDRQSLRLHLC